MSETFSGNRGLQLEEGLIFEIGAFDKSGVDLAVPADMPLRIGVASREPIALPGLSEPEAVRHYVRLSQKKS